MRISVATAIVTMIFVWPESIFAQMESGPKSGTKVSELKIFAATGDSAGKELNFAAERKAKPTVFVFVQADKWDRPMARFLRELDQALAKDYKAAQVIAVWLTDDVDKAKGYLPKAQESLKFVQTILAVYPGEKAGPAGWSINSDAHLTAVVADKDKVIASLGFQSLNETDVPAVIKKLSAK